MPASSPLPASPTLAQRLRSETRSEHQALEDGLDLLAAPPDRARLVVLLERFWGFHAVYEPALQARLPHLGAGRRRLALLTADLVALGVARERIVGLARCSEAAGLSDTRHWALGAFYVLEGSTLGGKIITRALTGTGAVPSTGLAYFDPYGAAAGENWRAVGRALAAAADPATDDLVVEGARRTFALLTQWLAPAFRHRHG